MQFPSVTKLAGSLSSQKERVVPKIKLKIQSEGDSLDVSITLGKDSAAVCFP